MPPLPILRRKRWIGAMAAIVALVALMTVPDSDGASARIKPSHPPTFSHVAVLVLENHEYGSVIGSPSAPYLTGLASGGAVATDYFGVSHPSLPNYLALTGGSTFGYTADCSLCKVEGRSLFYQLSAAQIPWKAYFEPGTRRVNPLIHYEGASGRAGGHVYGFGRLNTDLRRRALARFSWIGLNLCHDGHSCPVATSDRYLSRLVPRVLKALGPHGVLLMTWDEGTSHMGSAGAPGGGHVPLIALGGGARKGARSTAPATHYTLLRTIEQSFGLPALRDAASAPSSPISSLLHGFAHNRPYPAP